MPNWVENTASFKGSLKTIQKIAAAFESKNPFATLMPLTNPATGKKDLEFWDYDLAVEKWGVKWEANEIANDLIVKNKSEDNYEIYTSFLTAWGVPEDFYKSLSRKYNDLEIDITYVEESKAFIGASSYKNGHVFDFNMNENYDKVTSSMNEEEYEEWMDNDGDFKLVDELLIKAMKIVNLGKKFTIENLVDNAIKKLNFKQNDDIEKLTDHITNVMFSEYDKSNLDIEYGDLIFYHKIVSYENKQLSFDNNGFENAVHSRCLEVQKQEEDMGMDF